jgi:hypothetical protein
MNANTAREAREAELAKRTEDLGAATADVAEAEAGLTRSSDALDARQTRFAETAFLGAKNRATVAAALHAAAKKSLARQIEFEASDDYRETAKHLEESEAIANRFDIAPEIERLRVARAEVEAVQSVLDAKRDVQRAAVATAERLRAALGHRVLVCTTYGSCLGSTSPHEPACASCPYRRHVSAMAELAAMKPEAT